MEDCCGRSRSKRKGKVGHREGSNAQGTFVQYVGAGTQSGKGRPVSGVKPLARSLPRSGADVHGQRSRRRLCHSAAQALCSHTGTGPKADARTSRLLTEHGARRRADVAACVVSNRSGPAQMKARRHTRDLTTQQPPQAVPDARNIAAKLVDAGHRKVSGHADEEPGLRCVASFKIVRRRSRESGRLDGKAHGDCSRIG